jgi:hypothetical protein
MPPADVVQCRGSIRLLGNAFVLVQRWSPGGAYGEASDHEGARRRNLCMSLGLLHSRKNTVRHMKEARCQFWAFVDRIAYLGFLI